jgi:peptidyl-prolyl cis-trans isomerase SurA
MTELRRYIEAQIAFNRILAGKYKEKITVSDAEVDAKLSEFKQQVNSQLAKIKADPRMQPITVYQLLDISFPVDSPDLLQSRFAEAMQYSQQFKGCKSARAAASGIFNVRIGKTVEADGRKLPPQMKAAFSKAGSNKAIGPFRNKSGLQLWALCGTRKITPQLPKADLPNRDQVKNVLLNQKYDEVEKRYGRQFRESLLIEYRDQTYAN